MDKIFNMSPIKFIKYLAFVIGIVYWCSNSIVNSPDFVYKADIRAYYSVAKAIRDGNIRNIYNPQFQEEIQQEINQHRVPHILFLNLPVSALLFIPFTYVDGITAYKILTILNTVLILLACGILCYKFRIDWQLTFLLPLFLPIATALENNQLSGIVFLLYVLAAVYLRENPFKSGLSAGLLLLKIQHILLIPFLFLMLKSKESRIKFLSAVLLVWAVLSLSNVLLYGPKVFTDYISFLQSRDTSLVQQEKYQGYNLFSLSALLDPVLGYRNTFTILLFVETALYLVAMYFVSRNKDIKMGIAASVTFALTLNIHTKLADLVVLLVPLLILLKDLSSKFSTRSFVILLTFFIVPLVFMFRFYYIGAVLFTIAGFWLLVKRQI